MPSELREFDSRKNVRFTLKTDSRKEALRLAALQNSHLESYWHELIQTGKKHSHSAYEAVVKRARLFGFGYMPNAELAELPTHDLVMRLLHAKKENLSSTHVEAVMGGIPQPQIKLDDALIRFWQYAQNKSFNKSPNQLRKWKHPRQRAVANFIQVVGNKIITEINRDDILKFRDWWLNRIKEKNMVANSANKNFVHLKVILETVSNNLNLKIDIEHLFKKILLTEDDYQIRLPFTTDYIRETLLNAEKLQGLNEQAKAVLFAIAETGAGPAEQVGLMPEDIILDTDIPHIIIQPRQFKGLKTKYRKRIIPLVGYALDVFKAYPNGFTDYRDAPDRLSAVLGKFLRENNLLPTKQHTVYSLRHSFQDRLLAANAPDRVQSDLMGHKFNRQAYGNGTSLSQKLEWLNKIKLKEEI